MLSMLRDLVHHKAYANAAMLKAVRDHAPAAEDAELRKLLHHILNADRYFVLLSLGLPFNREKEAAISESLLALGARFEETHALELDWLAGAQEADLDRTVE